MDKAQQIMAFLESFEKLKDLTGHPHKQNLMHTITTITQAIIDDIVSWNNKEERFELLVPKDKAMEWASAHSTIFPAIDTLH
jgi:hypothetical protein